MAPKRTPSVIRTIDPNQEEIILTGRDGDTIKVQVCGSNKRRIQLRLEAPHEYTVETQSRSAPNDALQHVKPHTHPRSAGGGTDVRTDATRQP